MDFLEFLNKSVTPYHAVENLKAFFCAGAGKNAQLFERGGALIAVRPPLKADSGSRFKIALAHTDNPTLKITPNPDGFAAGVRTLHPEIYGSPIFASWLDRDLGYAGILAYGLEGKVQTRLIRGEKLFRIPQLAVHLNRNVNQDGLKLNPQTDLNALWTAVGGKERFVEALDHDIRTCSDCAAREDRLPSACTSESEMCPVRFIDHKRHPGSPAHAGNTADVADHSVVCGRSDHYQRRSALFAFDSFADLLRPDR